ncbi:hypothetical protein AKJ16_DCAP22562 [Drosera capensis]
MHHFVSISLISNPLSSQVKGRSNKMVGLVIVGHAAEYKMLAGSEKSIDLESVIVFILPGSRVIMYGTITTRLTSVNQIRQVLGSSMNDDVIRTLAFGSSKKILTWEQYYVNGFKFEVESRGKHKSTYNYGVMVSSADGGKDYYGILQKLLRSITTEICHDKTKSEFSEDVRLGIWSLHHQANSQSHQLCPCLLVQGMEWTIAYLQPRIFPMGCQTNLKKSSASSSIINDETGNPLAQFKLDPNGLWFTNYKVASAVGDAIRRYYNGPYTCWTHLPSHDREMIWKHFRAKFEWDPENAQAVFSEFKRKCMKRLMDTTNKAAKCPADHLPNWLSHEVHSVFPEAHSDPSFEKRSIAGKTNRRKLGDGVGTHYQEVYLRSRFKKRSKDSDEVMFIDVRCSQAWDKFSELKTLQEEAEGSQRE